MKTEKEKQLEIDLLVEKIQRISKKKVVFKEDVYYGDRYPKKTDSEVEKEIKEAILEVVNIDDETETLSVSKGGELVSFQCKFYTNNEGKRVRGAVHNVAEWDDTIESIQRIYPDYEVINKTLNGFALSNYNSKSPLNEDQFPDYNQDSKVLSQQEIINLVYDIVKSQTNWNPDEELAIDAYGHNGEQIDLGLRPIPSHLKGVVPEDPGISREEWEELANTVKNGLPFGYEYTIYDRGITFENKSLKESVKAKKRLKEGVKGSAELKKFIVIAEDPSGVYLDKPVTYKVMANNEEEALKIIQDENIEENDGDTIEIDTYEWTVEESPEVLKKEVDKTIDDYLNEPSKLTRKSAKMWRDMWRDRKNVKESTDNTNAKNYIAIARWTEDGEDKWDVIGVIGKEKLNQKEAEELARKSYSRWNKNAPEGEKTSDVQYKALVVTQARYDQLLSEEK